MHDHSHLSGDHNEHRAALDLVRPGDATHVAVGSGDWFDAANWAGGTVPGDDARVHIPHGIELTYAGRSDARIFTIGVEGTLRFDPAAESKLVLDTMVVGPSGELEIGTPDMPVTGNVDIVIAGNGAIDTGWDPMLLSRGIVSLGDAELNGAEVKSHLKVTVDPMAGDTQIAVNGTPSGWKVGDTIEIAGTVDLGYTKFSNNRRYDGDQNETRVITAIDGDTITFDRPLEFDHATPRDDLKTSVANFTRSITIRSEEGAASDVHERGHVMFMGSDDVNVRYVALDDLGRTDKSERSFSATSLDETQFDTNVQGRYSLHLHRLGIEDRHNPITVEGVAVTGSPGWGIVQHSSNANLYNNAVRDVWAASFVSEAGDETGVWSDNISLDNVGTYSIERLHSDVGAGDLARSGSGFWLQSRMVDVYDNVAANTRTGFVWIAQGSTTQVDASFTDQPEATGFGEPISSRTMAISLARDNEVFASERGLTVTKGSPNQLHDIRSMIDNFTAWEVREGIKGTYTAHYTFRGLDLIASATEDRLRAPDEAILLSNNASDFVFVEPKISGFSHAYNFTDFFTPSQNATQAEKQFFVIGGEVTGLRDSLFVQDDWQERTTLVDPDDIEIRSPRALDLNIPQIEEGRQNHQYFTGTRLDSLGEGPLALGTDDISFERNDIRDINRREGHWEKDGRLGIIYELFLQDRVTGELTKEGVFVPFVSNDLLRTSYYHGGTFNGVLPYDNTAPEARPDAAETAFRTDVVIDLIGNDTDADGHTLRLDGFVQPAGGRVWDNGDGTATYRPDLGFHGEDSFEYWVTDGYGSFTKSTVTVTVAERDVVDPDTITRTVHDTDDRHPWSEYTQVLAADGETQIDLVYRYDDGRILDIDFGATGIRTDQMMTDAGDAHRWSASQTFFASDGVTPTEKLTEFDDGRLRQLLYDVDGDRASRTIVDQGDAYRWAMETVEFGDDGETLTSKELIYDDGRVANTVFDADGMQTSRTVEDAADVFVWDTRVITFAADGETRTGLVITFDDGRILDVEFNDAGIRAARTMTDAGDVYDWASYTQTFDADGRLIDTVYIDDIPLF